MGGWTEEETAEALHSDRVCVQVQMGIRRVQSLGTKYMNMTLF